MQFFEKNANIDLGYSHFYAYSIYIKQINKKKKKNDVSAIPAGKSNYLKRLLFLLVCVLMLGNAVWAQQPTITL